MEPGNSNIILNPCGVYSSDGLFLPRSPIHSGFLVTGHIYLEAPTLTYSIKNWDQFQHYKNRRPPWIKLYRELLDDIEWHHLSGDASKMLVMLWIVASDHGGKLPSLKDVSFRLRVPESKLKTSLSDLSHWIINNASKTLAERKQDAMPEKRREETERETEDDASNDASTALVEQKPAPLTDIQKIVLCYKMVAGYPKEDKAWDKLNFARCSKSAKQLLDFMGNWKDAADCIEDVYEKFTAKGLTVTIETAVKHASEWKLGNSEKMDRI